MEASRRRLDQAGFSPCLGSGEQESGGPGSMGAEERGSGGAGERRRMHRCPPVPLLLCTGRGLGRRGTREQRGRGAEKRGRRGDKEKGKQKIG
jgi:hypothetical protein